MSVFRTRIGATGAEGTSTAAHQSLGRRGAGAAFAAVRCDVQRGGTAVDSARAAVEGVLADGAAHGAQRAAVLRATRLQLFVPLVSGLGGRRGELRPLDLFAQPPTAPGARGGGRVLPRRGGTGARA